MNGEFKATQEGVLIVCDAHDEPIYMVRKNGVITYFKLEPMGFEDHAEFLGAERVQPLRE